MFKDLAKNTVKMPLSMMDSLVKYVVEDITLGKDFRANVNAGIEVDNILEELIQ